jgi:hypothetical protein
MGEGWSSIMGVVGGSWSKSEGKWYLMSVIRCMPAVYILCMLRPWLIALSHQHIHAQICLPLPLSSPKNTHPNTSSPNISQYFPTIFPKHTNTHSQRRKFLSVSRRRAASRGAAAVLSNRAQIRRGHERMGRECQHAGASDSRWAIFGYVWWGCEWVSGWWSRVWVWEWVWR